MALSASIAAESALMPSCGAPPAREARAVALDAQAALDAGQCEAGFGSKAELAHRVGDERGGLGFVEARFGVMQDRLAQFDDRIAVAVDRLAHLLLQFVLCRHARLSRLIAISSLSAPGRRAPREVGDSTAPAYKAHLTLPRLHRGPLPLPLQGRRGILRRPRTVISTN